MNSDQWKRVEAVFKEAARLPASEREDFVEEACGADAALRDEVLSLLSNDDSQFLEDSPADDTLSFVPGGPPAADSSSAPPSTIGPYEIVGVLGEGGMGTVYRARQTEPVRRDVALKVIRPGMDSAAIVARFQAERQALANLDHPAIATILDGGTTPEGCPYFVMEYVPGEPFAEFCDRREWSVRKRLRLFVALCQAVQHAHFRGIIHRDLKPSNVLVSEAPTDHKAMVRVIDFGVAKAVDTPLTDRAMHTEVGTMIGTPEYMSPEQALAGPEGIDTRTDVYSLGVMLYELLTGALPFEPVELRQAGPLEMQRRIVEDTPVRPSTRLSSLDSAESNAARRQTSAGTLTRQLAGDLDWIVMSAIEKDRDRRYASAAELAADVERYLANEPIAARPPSWRYLLKKFIRRHRVGVTAALIVFVGLTVGIVATIVNLRDAANRKDEIFRLSDLRRYEEAVGLADLLWPSVPTKVDEMRAWLRDHAEPLAASLPVHTARLEYLEELLQGGGSDSAADARMSRYERISIREHEEVAAILDRLAARGDLSSSVRKRFAENANTARQWVDYWKLMAAEGTGLMADEELQWEYGLLQSLVEALERFLDPNRAVGTVADVRWRLHWAETMETLTTSRTAEWEAAIGAIADCTQSPRYRGLRIEPQLGLVPLGPDPTSGFWEFAHVQSGSPPQRRQDGSLVMGEGTGIVFVLIPGGSFAMGSDLPIGPFPAQPPYLAPNLDPRSRPAERPTHLMHVEPFLISKYEMTQGQWLRLTNTNPSEVSPSRPRASKAGVEITANLRHPVESISWNTARKELVQLGLELPTEAQWEYATRAGTTTIWHTGDDPVSLIGYANLADQTTVRLDMNLDAAKQLPELDDGYARHAPVGSFLPNAFGLHDVHGNVWEWCRDRSAYYSEPVFGPGSMRVSAYPDRMMRGGGYANGLVRSRSATRLGYTPDRIDSDTGVRPLFPLQ